MSHGHSHDGGVCPNQGEVFDKTVLRKLFHWGPIIALSLICGIAAGTIHVLFYSPFFKGAFFNTHLVSFSLSVLMLLVSYLCAIKMGPGFAPESYKKVPKELTKKLQYCHKCEIYKPPRAHHCRVCDRCCLKMDHHCPWINSCVGHKNHKSFVLFLFYVMTGTSHAVFINVYHIYKILVNYGISPRVLLYILDAVVLVLFAAAVYLAIFILFFYQMRSILRNKTEIEVWIVNKAEHRRTDDASLEPFVYPYDLGLMHNFDAIFGELLLGWFVPTKSLGNGCDFEVIEGVDKYALTFEQLEQKKEKRAQMQRGVVVKPYSGNLIGWGHGMMIIYSSPSMDAPRLKISVGDLVDTTRIEKRWVYGSLTFSNGKELTPKERMDARGWFPRECIQKVKDDKDDNEENDKDEETIVSSNDKSKIE